MFEAVYCAPQEFSPRSLITSIVVHGLAIAVILSLRFAPAPANPFRYVQAITLIAPVVSQPALQPAPEIAARTPRRFRLSPVRPHPARALAVDLPPAPVLETTSLPVAALELPRTLEPPRTAPAPNLMIKPAGFSGIETYVHASPRATLSATGSFDVVSARQPGAPRPTASVGSGFGDISVAAPVPSGHKSAMVPQLVPVEIISKPRPVYTGEALRLRIEGEVLLEVLFRATGEIDIIGVRRGLGHGLDESAIAAAREIRFRPAQTDAGPIDSPAVVHIVFQLAY